MRSFTFVACTLLACARFSSPCRGSDVTSTWAAASSATWEVNANWTNVPASGGFPNNGNAGVGTYDAVISATGSAYAITASSTLNVQALQLTSTNATLTQSALSLSAAGPFSWTAGTLTGAGQFNANGGITLNGGNVALVSSTLNLPSGQNASETSTGQLTMTNGAVFNNAGSVFLSTTLGIVSTGSPNMINNSGAFTRDSTTGVCAVGPRFNNTGTVTVAMGTLSLNGAVSQYSAGTLSGGAWVVMANSTLNGSGLANITIIGSSASVTLNGANSTFTLVNNLNTNNGTFAVTGGRTFVTQLSTPFSNSGTITVGLGSSFSTPLAFTWTNGMINGGGAFNANAGTTLSGSNGKTLSGTTYTSNNALTMTGTGALTLTNGATFNNPSTFTAQSDAGIANGTGTNIFNNTTPGGTFARNTSNGTFAIDVPFNNASRVNVNSGTLLFNGGVTQYSAGTQTLSGGIWSILANSTLGGTSFGPITTNSGNVTLNGLNSVFTPINSVTINTGVLVIMGGRNFATAGALANSATLTAGVGSTIALSGPFTWTAGILNGGGTFNANAGISLSGTAITTLSGSTLNNPAGQTTTVSGSGALLMQTDATFANAGSFLAQSDASINAGSGNNVFNNTGTFARNTSSGTYVVACNFSNSGEVDVTSGTLQFNGTVSQSALGQMVMLGGSITFLSSYVNNGALTATGPAALTFNGPVTNNGYMLVRGGATFGGTSASFMNNGTLDIITAGVTLPPGFVNNGIVLDSSVVKIRQSSLAGATFTALIDSYSGHTYQLQRSSSLSSGTFSSIGAPQAGTTGVTLSFTDPSAPSTEGFYRVLVSP